MDALYRADVVDERQVRATAGITLVLGAVAFAEAFVGKTYWPIRLVTTFFVIDFLARITLGLHRSPTGALAGLLTRAGEPEPTAVAPKRFAWTLGSVMAAFMAVVTNVGITGALPASVCTLCLTLMWLEAVLGFCVACWLYRRFTARGWTTAAGTVCADGACAVPAAEGTAVAR